MCNNRSMLQETALGLTRRTRSIVEVCELTLSYILSCDFRISGVIHLKLDAFAEKALVYIAHVVEGLNDGDKRRLQLESSCVFPVETREELVLFQFPHSETAAGIALEEAIEDKVFEIRVTSFQPVRVVHAQLLVDDALHNLELVVCMVERSVAGVELEQQDPEGPEVDLVVMALFLDDLRCQVLNSSHNRIS